MPPAVKQSHGTSLIILHTFVLLWVLQYFYVEHFCRYPEVSDPQAEKKIQISTASS